MTRHGQNAASIVTSLQAKKAEYVHGYPGKKYVSGGGEDAFGTVIRKLSEKANASGNVRTTLNTAHDQAARLLLDPVRDASGKLVLQDNVSSFSCHLQ